MKRLCPSAPAQAEGARVFGVATGPAATRRIAYLEAAVDFDPALAEAIAPLQPNEVLRTTATCAESACRHFSGNACELARRIATQLDAVVDRAPPCPIRRECRWWGQEGLAACLRCPQVVTASQPLDQRFSAAADPR